MPATIRFKRFDPEKFIQVASYLASKCPSMTKKKLLKLVYFADKKHLLRYGRPILSDHYINMEQGPVASNAYDILKSNHRVPTVVLERFAEHITIQGYRLKVRRAAGIKRLTESDLEVLDEIISHYGRKTPNELSVLSHREKTWRLTKTNQPIDYQLFFESPDEVTIMGELVKEDQLVRDLVKNGRFSEEQTTA